MIKRQNILLLLFAWMCILSIQTAFAQSDNSGQRRVTGTYAITNATIITKPGSLTSNATIIIKEGIIQHVGRDLSIPTDALVIPGDSLYVYPGFIDAMGSQGVSAFKEVEKPKDYDPSNPPNEVAGITPERDVLDCWDLGSQSIESWRNAGITIAQVVPEGQMLPGKSALVTFGGPNSSNVLEREKALYAQFETPRDLYPGTVLGIMAKWRELYENATLKSRHAELFAATSNGISRPEKDQTLEAFYPVIRGQVPVIFKTKDELEIRRVLKLQNELGFSLILSGVEKGSSLADDIKSSSSKVVLSLNLPDKKAAEKSMDEATEEAKMAHARVKEAYEEALAEARKFEEANIPFAFSTKGINKDKFIKNIRLMIDHGLSEKGALAALTIHPAAILGISDFAGTLEKGKLANLVVSTDSLFKENTAIKYVMADGYLFEYDVDKAKKEKGDIKDIVGTWKYISETPGGSSDGTIDFTEVSGDLKGEIVVDDPDGSGDISRELTNIHYDGSTLSFSFTVMVKGEKIMVDVKGKVKEKEFDGALTIKDMGNYSIRATRDPDFKF